MAEEQGKSGSRKHVGGDGLSERETGLDGRLDRLDAALAARREEDRKAQDKAAGRESTGYGKAMRMSSEFIAGVLVGAGLGWAVDRWAGTAPWGLIAFLLLGFGAGVLNVLRATGEVAEFGQRQDEQGEDS